MVTMRDGVHLSVDIYAPKSSETLPGILSITPYSNTLQLFQDEARWYAARGYVVVMADSRGRYDSEGTWNPFDARHKADGYDLVEWIAKQTWSNGKVGMIGMSYQAVTQWWTASMAPPHLAVIVPQVSPPDWFYNVPYQDGALTGWFFCWSAWMSGRTMQPIDIEKFGGLSALLKHTPYIDIRSILGMESAPWFDEIYEQNKASDPYWKGTFVQNQQSYSNVRVPSLAFSGWFDVNHPGTPMNYLGMKKYGSTPDARLTRMIIGPWVHHINTRVVGGIDYGPDAVIDVRGYTTRWLDRFLKGIDNGAERDPPVHVFVMGENKWHSEQDWPLPEATPTDYFLVSGGHANSLKGDGLLSTDPPQHVGSDTYVYDPHKPTLDPFDSAVYENHGALDTRLSAIGDEVLVYQTSPLTSPVEVTGPVEATLYAATSARDTDWMMRLVDVLPDGRSLLLTEGVVRARSRDPANEGRFSASQLSVVESGKVYKYIIQFWRGTANLFQRGHRIRVELSSSWYPYYAPNLNTGADNLATVRMSDAVVARQVIYHAPDYPSHISLPIVHRSQ